MKEMNDNELDALIKDSFQRQEILDSINQNVMQTVKRQSKSLKIRQWARLLAYCFGIPLVVMGLLGCAYHIATEIRSIPVIASMGFFALTIIIWGIQSLRGFYFDKV